MFVKWGTIIFNEETVLRALQEYVYRNTSHSAEVTRRVEEVRYLDIAGGKVGVQRVELLICEKNEEKS